MKLASAARIHRMTPWQVIEEALGRRKPPRKPQWLADQLDVSAQVIGNWKARQVPPARFRAIADVLGLSVDQIEGLAPLPWESEAGWPFPDINEVSYRRLTEMQKGEIQRKVREMITEFEDATHKAGKIIQLRLRRPTKKSSVTRGPALILQFSSSVAKRDL